jgi:hypothetical protein
MAALLVFVAVPFLIDSLTTPGDLLNAGTNYPIRLLRRVSEDEVIAEFLKSDFENPVFKDYRSMRELVTKPNFDQPSENAKRRALLFIRHLALWKEIPSDTEWYEVEVKEQNLDHIRVFPRAQWRKLARGSFSIREVAENLLENRDLVESSFLSKITSIEQQLSQDCADFGAVILIGVDENRPLAVLDGNHRLVAALLSDSQRLQQLKFICGLSPRMAECCWYNTNLVTLFHYATNVMTQAMNNPEAELARLLETSG